MQVGDPIVAGEHDVFLTSRWGLLRAARPDQVRYTAVEHDPWPLQQATVQYLDDTLVAATGLPQPQHRMVVRYSPGVHVRIGMPQRLSPGPPTGGSDRIHARGSNGTLPG